MALWVELFHADNRHVLTFGFFAMLQEVVINFSGAQDDAFDLFGGSRGVRQNSLEAAFCQFVQR